MKTFLSFLFSALFIFPMAQGYNESNFIDHHKIKAKRGDGVIKLLKKYDLISHQCNIDAFYEINGMKKKDVLYAGSEYKMPISIYQYNKQSIRSTIGKDDWDLAKKIAAYNRVLRDKKIKRTYYLEDAVLYVPVHMMDCFIPGKVKGERVGPEVDEKKTASLSKEVTANPSSQAKEEKVSSFEHVATKAKKGDGVFHLLKRYGLSSNSCNQKAFYKINGLKEGKGLYAGKTYHLPIRIYTYNRESIRSTVGRDDWDMARAIAAYNRSLVDNGLKKNYYMEDAILYVPFHFLGCPEGEKINKDNKVVAEEKKVYLTNSLYGKHARFEKESDDLKDEAYYVISGHGGPDPGAMCTHGKSALCEDEYAYDVSLRLARKLEANGAKVFMIIQDKNDGIRDYPLLPLDYDEVCMTGEAIPRKQIHRLKQRVVAANNAYRKSKGKYKKHKLVSIHVDSRPTHKRQDVFFYHCPGSETGKKLANNIQDVFRKKYKIHRKNGAYHGTVSERGLYVLRHTDPVAVFVELANIRNHMDQKRIIVPSQRQTLANWLYEGLTK